MSLPLSIVTLKGRENYNSWSRNVRTYLMAEGLWNTVRSPNSRDAEKNLRANYIIICSVEDNLLENIDADATPNVVWMSLQKQCKT